MFPYWILFSIFALGSLDYRRRGPIGGQGGILLVLAAIFTGLMVGLRFYVGGDWGSYERIFDTIRYMDAESALRYGDPGYAFVNWTAHALGAEIWFVNLVCGVIFTWGLLRFARQQPNPWLAMLVAVPYLIIVVAMGYTRQAVAIGIVMAGLASLNRTSLLRFSVYILFAVAFHKSAIVVLPLVALAASRNRIVTIGLLILLMATLYYSFVSASMDILLTNYVDAQYQSQGALVRALMNLPPALIFLRYQHSFQLEPSQRLLWRNFSIAALVALAALGISASSTAVDRLALYLIPLQIFVFSRIPEIFAGRRQANSQIVLGVIVYSACIQLVWLNHAVNAYYWLPYRVYPLFSTVDGQDE